MNATMDLEAEINRRLAAAERLLTSAAMVGDRSDHDLWKRSRDLWVRTTTRELTGSVGEDVMRTFARAVTPPAGEGSVAEDLPVELEALRNAMAILIGIRSQTAAPASSPRPAVERRDHPRRGP